MAFQVVIDDATFRTDDLTLNEATDIEKACGVSWLRINPFNSAEQCRAIITVFLTRTKGADEAAKIVGAMTVTAALECLSVAEDDRPTEFEDGIPKAGAGTVTTGS